MTREEFLKVLEQCEAPYSQLETKDVQYVSVDDGVLIVAHKNYAPMKIIKQTDGKWGKEEIIFKDRCFASGATVVVGKQIYDQ